MSKKGAKEDPTQVLNKDVQQIKDLITDIVAPQYRQNINVIQEHITVLHGKKSKKQRTRKIKPKKQLKTITKKDNQNLGLYTIPSKSMKYNDAIPLYKLWKGYIKEQLNLNENLNIPNVYDPGYDNFSKLLVKIDLHGSKVNVIKSRCPSYIGLNGIVILDTKNTLKIISKDNKIRTIPKIDCIFNIKYLNLDFIIFGKHLTIRSAERSVKKVKNLIDLDL